MTVKLWIVSRIDTPTGWPVLDSVWLDQKEAVAHMLRMKGDAEAVSFPRYFIGLKLVDSYNEGTDQRVAAPTRRGVQVSVRAVSDPDAGEVNGLPCGIR